MNAKNKIELSDWKLGKFTDNQFEAASLALLGEDRESVLDGVFSGSMSAKYEMTPKQKEILEELGWVNENNFTEIGALVRDPVREYIFWKQRDKEIPSQGLASFLTKEFFYQKQVLEIGCGAGCNLFSLQDFASKCVGVEPVPIYRQFSEIISEMECLPSLNLVESFGEEMPFEDNSFDVLLCYTSHQYMDVKAAVQEMHRIVRVGGVLIIVGDVLSNFAKYFCRESIPSLSVGKIKYDGLTILNTVWYQVFGKRLFVIKVGTTSSPIYPAKSFMMNAFKDVGFEITEQDSHILPSGEIAFSAKKINASF